MSKATEIIEMCFRGEGITPDNLKASEIADLIASYEDALLCIIARNNPEINLEEVFVSLVGIEENSVHLKFKPKVLGIVLSAAIVINSAIISNQYQALPFKSVESLNRIWAFTKRRNCSGEISGGEDLPVARISVETEIKISDEFFYQGDTTIYGVVERVGGSIPRVRIKLDNNQVIYAEIKESVAKRLAKNLYEAVCLKGFAKWRKENLKIEEFKIDQVIDFTEIPLSEAFQDLKGLIGQSWDEIGDPIDYLNTIRYQTEI
jgi:hypothetical protein